MKFSTDKSSTIITMESSAQIPMLKMHQQSIVNPKIFIQYINSAEYSSKIFSQNISRKQLY
uniref:Putative ovule protein n=1 Tax=Solanum chacoense TaxID=4108 RepID=A0A0V0GR52_SOLCH